MQTGFLKGIPFINLAPAINQLTPREITRMFLPDPHYTQESNRFVAEALLRRMAGHSLGFPGCGPDGIAPVAGPDSGRP